MKRHLSMFWRQFLALWLGSALLMIGSSLLIAIVADREMPRQVQTRVQTLLGGSARSLALLHGRMPEEDFRATLESIERRYDFRLFLLDASGRDVIGRPVPERVRRVGAQLRAASGDSRLQGMPPLQTLVFGEIVRDARGAVLHAVIDVRGPPLPGVRFILGTMLVPLLFSILIAGMFSALSARYLVKPIDLLRQATRRFASGELEHRVGASLRARRDEFSTLAADFDAMADRIAELIGAQRQLMLDLSHELRSPLARMRVAVELMRDHPQAHLLDRMERDTDRMDVLIGELLLLARLESPHAPLQRTRVDLAELVADIVEDAHLEIAGQPRTVRHEAPRDERAIDVDGDRELLRRAVENVVRNALQYSPRDADVRVILERDGGHARIRVVDAGPGFPAEAVPRLFAPFARSDWSDNAQGHGLGLAIARAAMQRHGGTIELGARADARGADVVLRLPLAD